VVARQVAIAGQQKTLNSDLVSQKMPAQLDPQVLELRQVEQFLEQGSALIDALGGPFGDSLQPFLSSCFGGLVSTTLLLGGVGGYEGRGPLIVVSHADAPFSGSP
jgi:hypothetical protein